MSDKLPQPNYEKSKKNNSFTKKNQNELPDIRTLSNRKKQKIKEGNGDLLNSSQIETRSNPQVIKKKCFLYFY